MRSEIEVFGLGQRARVNLAVNIQGKRLQLHEVLRDHRLRQRLSQALPKRARIDRALLGVVTRQGIFSVRHRMGHDERLIDLGIGSQGVVDYPKLDADAVHLDLPVEPSDKLDITVGQQPAQVARSIEDVARIVRERLRTNRSASFRTAEIPFAGRVAE